MKILRRLIPALAAAASLLATGARAEAPAILGLHYDGSGCSEPGSVLGSLTDQGDGRYVYGLVLARLDAATVLPSTDIVNNDCAVTVEVRPPRGYQMRIAAVMLQGRHDAPQHATTTAVYSSYRMYFPDGEGPSQMEFQVETNHRLEDRDLGGGLRITDAQGIGQDFGNWQLTVDTHDDNWSPCNAAVSLEGVVSAMASSDDGATDAEIAVQRSDVTTAQGLAWGWQFRRCGGGQQESGFDGRWSSSYAAGAQSVSAALDIAGDAGSFRTSSFTGQLFALRREGRDLVGSWSGLGQQGWLRFTLAADGRSFTGSYGLAGQRRASGWWNGRR
jgi:hypothetical protein